MILSEFKKLPILGILRGINESMLEPLTHTIIDSGLKAIEITMNTASAGSLIKKMKSIAGDKLFIGAGTVLSMVDLKMALDSGAGYIVMPVIIDEIMDYCVKNNVPVFPGAITPNEVFNAYTLGASMVKVFPIKFYGPGYISELKGPLDKIELLACGGVTAENIPEFFLKGASAVAFGGGVFKKEWLENERYDLIKNDITAIIQSYRNWEKSK